MIKTLTYTLFLLLASAGLLQGQIAAEDGNGINVKWVANIDEDFSFNESWDYPEGVYKNEFGQLSCDGFCAPETESMKDEHGRIHEDSLSAFYKLFDTSHQFYSIQSEAETYEWAGTNFVTAVRYNNGTILCFSHTNAATHSRLVMTISENGCIPTIELNSIANSSGTRIFPCRYGKITIDKELRKQGILKASFDFAFYDNENPGKSMYWKGKIYAPIVDR